MLKVGFPKNNNYAIVYQNYPVSIEECNPLFVSIASFRKFSTSAKVIVFNHSKETKFLYDFVKDMDCEVVENNDIIDYIGYYRAKTPEAIAVAKEQKYRYIIAANPYVFWTRNPLDFSFGDKLNIANDLESAFFFDSYSSVALDTLKLWYYRCSVFEDLEIMSKKHKMLSEKIILSYNLEHNKAFPKDDISYFNPSDYYLSFINEDTINDTSVYLQKLQSFEATKSILKELGFDSKITHAPK